MSTHYCLVTGANRGLGLEFARQLLARGDRVIAACRNPGKAGALNTLAGEYPGRLRMVPLDVAEPRSHATLVRERWTAQAEGMCPPDAQHAGAPARVPNLRVTLLTVVGAWTNGTSLSGPRHPAGLRRVACAVPSRRRVLRTRRQGRLDR